MLQYYQDSVEQVRGTLDKQTRSKPRIPKMYTKKIQYSEVCNKHMLQLQMNKPMDFGTRINFYECIKLSNYSKIKHFYGYKRTGYFESEILCKKKILSRYLCIWQL